MTAFTDYFWVILFVTVKPVTFCIYYTLIGSSISAVLHLLEIMEIHSASIDRHFEIIIFIFLYQRHFAMPPSDE